MKNKRSGGYSTRQRTIITEYIKGLGDRHVTAAQIAEHFRSMDIAIGRTTIYRHLDRLEAGGILRRYTVDGSGACYQYVPGAEECSAHFHLKCEECGDVIHLECDTLNNAHKHISAEHMFTVNSAKSVIYGRCVGCERGSANE